MNKKHTLLLIFLFLSLSNTSQNLVLELKALNANDTHILNTIKVQEALTDKKSVMQEVSRISEHLKNIGYFTNTLDSLVKSKKNKFTAYYSLNKRVSIAKIEFKKNKSFYEEDYSVDEKYAYLKIENLQTSLNQIKDKLDKQGESFSKTQLQDITIYKDTLFATLQIQSSKRRIINKTILKGYESFPKSFLKNYFKVNDNSIFNQAKLKEISDLSNELDFVIETKKPEVLFKQDSTLLYLYLKKHQKNSIDGIVNFATKENGDFLFNGNLDLKLLNILNFGERINLFWNSIGDERQEFKLSVKTPYILNTKLSTEVNFTIYRQDSTFSNTKLITKLNYNTSNTLKYGLTFSTESSENFTENEFLNSFNNLFGGVNIELNTKKDILFDDYKFLLKVNPSVGRRKANTENTNQIKLESEISYILKINNTNYFYIKNSTGLLDSENYLDNELFRIGGANSIRGFNEQSFFTQNFTYFNMEYRLLTSNNSYLYSITDIGKLSSKGTTNNLLGLGIGYLFRKENLQLNFNLAIGASNNLPFNTNNTKLIISWVNYF